MKMWATESQEIFGKHTSNQSLPGVKYIQNSYSSVIKKKTVWHKTF